MSGDPAPLGPELLGVDTGVRAESSVEPPQNRGWWVGIAALGLLGVVGWSLLAGGDAEEVTEETTTTTEPTTTTTTARSTTTTRRSTTTVPAVKGWEVRELGDGEPVLGVETGLWILQASSGGIEAIDLDAGLAYDLGIDAFQLFARHGDWVVGADRQGTFALDLETLTQTRLPGDLFPTNDPAPDGQAWFATLGNVGPETLVLFDLADGTALSEVELPETAGYFWPGSGTFRTLSPPSGGVYRVEVDGAERIADGAVVAGAGSDLLVERCDERLDCSLSWIDEAGTPTGGRALPTVEFDEVRLVPGSDWLILQRWRLTLESTAFDTVTGREIDLGSRDWVEGVAASLDGRWLIVTGSSFDIIDLSIGEAVPSRGLHGDYGVWFDEPPDLDAWSEARNPGGADSEDG